jgi:hypothetical protein
MNTAQSHREPRQEVVKSVTKSRPLPMAGQALAGVFQNASILP